MTVERLILENTESRDNSLLRQAYDSMEIDVICVDRYSLDGLPQDCPIDGTALSGGWTFCRNVARLLRGHVLEPAEDFLPSLPFEYVNRQIKLMTLATARLISVPQFIKPASDKLFQAAVYDQGSNIPITESMADRTDPILVLTSDPVVWELEYRLFVLDRSVRALSAYRWTDQKSPSIILGQEARRMGELLLSDSTVVLPRAVVLDVGMIAGVGWAVVEANAAPMSGIYECDPKQVLEVLEASLAAHATPPTLPTYLYPFQDF